MGRFRLFTADEDVVGHHVLLIGGFRGILDLFGHADGIDRNMDSHAADFYDCFAQFIEKSVAVFGQLPKFIVGDRVDVLRKVALFAPHASEIIAQMPDRPDNQKPQEGKSEDKCNSDQAVHHQRLKPDLFLD